MHEVIRPDVVRVRGAAGDSRSLAAPPVPGLLRDSELQPLPQSPDPLVVDVQARAPQQRPGATVAEARVFLGDLAQLLAQVCIVRLADTIGEAGAP